MTYTKGILKERKGTSINGRIERKVAKKNIFLFEWLRWWRMSKNVPQTCFWSRRWHCVGGKSKNCTKKYEPGQYDYS